MRQPFPLARALFVLTAVSVAGCRCDKGTLGTNYGEVSIIWRDAEGNRITSRDATLDFGVGLVGDEKTVLANASPAVLTVKNVGSNRLTITSLDVTEGDETAFGPAMPITGTATSQFEAEFEKLELDSTDQHEFKLAFTPKVTRANFMTKLSLKTEGTRAEDSEAVITLLGKADLSACDLPTVIDFGKTAIGESLTFTIPMHNPTHVEATGNAGDITGTDLANFGYVAPSAAGPVVVPAESTTDIVIRFSPTEHRTYEAQVVMHGAGECQDQTIILKGEGSDETLTWTPDTIDYGLVNPGEEVIREVTFTNPASVPVTLTGVTSSNPADFYVVPATAGAPTDTFVVPGGSAPTAMKIACNPSALGVRLGVIQFQTGLTQTPAGTITLRCTGGGPRIKVTPRPTLAFGQVPYTTGSSTQVSVQRRVNVQNVGVRAYYPDGGVDPAGNLYLGIDQGPPLFEIVGANAAEFSAGFASGAPYDPVNGLAAVPGTFVDIGVTLTPTSAGSKSATLIVHSNDSQEPDINVALTADVQPQPPCNFTVVPSVANGLNFGLVASGETKDLAMTVTNTAATTSPTEVCYFSGFELAAGTDLAYSLVSVNGSTTPPATVTLNPQQTFEIVVRVAPTGPQPSMLTALDGQMVFNTTSAAQTRVQMPLHTLRGPACLTVAPDPMDFGTVHLDCYSPTRTFNIYNTCGSAVTLQQVSLQAPSHVAQGTGSCTTAGGCDEFHLVSSPSVPMTIAAGNSAPVTFQAKYSPYDVGSDSGAIAITVLQSGQTVTYLVGLVGAGSTDGTQVDTYTQSNQPMADVLLVVDNSCSMQDKQSLLASNFSSFINYAQSANVDYRIGVVTTTVDEACPPGIPFGCPSSSGDNGANGHLWVDGPTQLKWVTPQTPAVAQVFGRMVNVGTDSPTNELPLAAAAAALTPPVISNENAGFLRDEANLAVVVVTDASDQSPQPVSYYEDLLLNVKGYQRLSYFTFSAISPRNGMGGTSSCAYDESGADSSRYDPITSATSGVTAEICNNNWAATLQNLGQTAFGQRTQFYLQNQPANPTSVVVRVNGMVVPTCPATPTCYTYNSTTNSVTFNTAPQSGQTLEFQYQQFCYGP